MKGEKPVCVHGAPAANPAISIMKFIAAFLTGSSAMLAEGLHSIMAVILFSTWAGGSICEGVTARSHPNEMKNVVRNYAVLGVSFFAAGISWTIAFRKLLAQK